MIQADLFAKAKAVLGGGVNSPVRAITPYPFYTSRGEGARIFDQEGHAYVDYCLAYGPLLLGHNHPAVRAAVEEQLQKGWCFGTPTVAELEFAQFITRHVPN